MLPLLDYERLEYLKNRMRAKFPVLIESYIRDGRKYADEAGDAISSCNVDALIAATHTLKSSSGTLGLPKVRETAEKIEYKAKQMKKEGINSFDEIRMLYPVMKQDFDSTVALLAGIEMPPD